MALAVAVEGGWGHAAERLGRAIDLVPSTNRCWLTGDPGNEGLLRHQAKATRCSRFAVIRRVATAIAFCLIKRLMVASVVSRSRATCPAVFGSDRTPFIGPPSMEPVARIAGDPAMGQRDVSLKFRLRSTLRLALRHAATTSRGCGW